MYVDEVYYHETFKGEPVDPADFPGLCRRAGELVEELTLYRLTEIGFLVMPAELQSAVKNAVCAQIEYLDANGGAELDMGAGMAGGTLGKFSYSGSSSGNGSTEQSIFSPRAERILWTTGLTYRGGRI